MRCAALIFCPEYRKLMAGDGQEKDLLRLLGRLLGSVGALPAATVLACPTALGTLKSLVLLVGAKCWTCCLPPHKDHGRLPMPHAAALACV